MEGIQRAIIWLDCVSALKPRSIIARLWVRMLFETRQGNIEKAAWAITRYKQAKTKLWRRSVLTSARLRTNSLADLLNFMRRKTHRFSDPRCANLRSATLWTIFVYSCTASFGLDDASNHSPMASALALGDIFWTFSATCCAVGKEKRKRVTIEGHVSNTVEYSSRVAAK